MKTNIFAEKDVWEIYKKYEQWLKDNKNVDVVATSLFQRQLDTMNGTSMELKYKEIYPVNKYSMGHIYLLVTYK